MLPCLKHLYCIFMKNRKPITVLIVLVILALAGASIAYSLYHAPHRQASTETPAISLRATDLYKAFAADEAKANTLYLDKVLQVQGVVKEILTDDQGGKVLVLESGDMFGINCTIDSSQSQVLTAVKPGNQVTLKGICNGMLMDVVLVKCVLVHEN